MCQLSMLKSLLNDSNLLETQQRLSNKSLPKGIAVLLHGSPGTGKTESVMQIARETDRMIMKVEISQMRSKWYGENERLTKGIFRDYASLNSVCDRTPILLFNEADAIFSTRTSADNSKIDKMENTVQNILLEELEHFSGIMIATTNLAKNFDAAFERRFLFKIRFDKPDISVNARIWKLKMPDMPETDCKTLASKFHFSGGQIDNVVRKNEIHQVIYGDSDSIDTIMDFCKEEEMQKSRAVVGFRQQF